MLEFARLAYESGPLPPGSTNAKAELAATLVELSRQQRDEIRASASQGAEEVADGLDSGDNGSTTWTDEPEYEQASAGAPSRATTATGVMEEPDDADV